MAQYIEIKEGELSAKVAPNNGGMIAQLTLGGRPVLMFDEDAIEMTPMGALGASVMFPFPGKTKDDAYTIDGRQYRMPMHGLVKNGTFAVKKQADNALTLWCDASASQRQANYPFDYMLEIEYKIAGASLFSTALVTNRSAAPMPHYLGWHPYFRATDKAALKFEHGMAYHYNHVTGVDGPAPEEMELSRHWDHVLHSPKSREVTLCNRPDGYKARYILDEAHKVLVVYTGAKDAVCLEPWCALPNSINNGRFVETVQPGQTKRYTVELALEKL